jgi:ubiquinol-cytochrome c reductase cytochrome b subunit
MDEAAGVTGAGGPDGDPAAPERTSSVSETPPEAESYLERRLALGALDYGVPEAARRWPYYLGGLTAFLLVVLVVTGVYLAQFYHPDPLGAHDSVLYIVTRAPLGDWMRSLHVWASSAVTVTIAAHLAWVFWRRSYRPPREMTWWAGVVLAGLVFMLLVTGTVLRWDQEGFEALAHLTAGGEMTGALGLFFTEGFTRSTSLLSRVFSLHTNLLPLALVALVGLHFWLIRHLGLHASGPRNTRFREHATRLAGLGLLVFAALGLLAALAPEGLGYPPVSGVEVTKPFWPLLWVYGLENLIGMRGMVVGPAVLFTFLLCVPFLDRGPGDEPGRHGWVGWLGAALGLAVLALWIYAVVAPRQQHLGM